MKLTLTILASILSSLLLCGLCYLCYILGQRTYVRKPLEELGKEQMETLGSDAGHVVQKNPVVIQENPMVFQGPGNGTTYVTQRRVNSPRIMSTGREFMSPRGSPRPVSPPRIVSMDPGVRVLR